MYNGDYHCQTNLQAPLPGTEFIRILILICPNIVEQCHFLDEKKGT